MANVLVNDASLADIANAIREKNGTEETYKPAEMGDAVRAIESGGGEDNPFKYATLRSGSQMFYGAVFPEDYHLKIHVKGNTDTVYMNNWFGYTNVKEITLGFDIFPTSGLNLNNLFSGNNQMTDITFENNPFVINAFNGGFNDCISLENIKGVLDISKIASANNSFGKCYKLKEVRFVQNSIYVLLNFEYATNLSSKSIQSIIDGLATVETATTLKLHADVKAKLTETQIAAITGKNWTLA